MNFQERHSFGKDDQQYVYHYSSQRFPVIKNRKMLGLPAPEAASNPEEYNQTISLLPSPLSKEIINEYRAKGFKAWGSGPIYEYKISIPKNASAFPGEIRMTSVPEDLHFQRKFPYDKYFKDRGIDRPRVLKDDKYYEEVKDEYNMLRKEYIAKKDEYVRHLIAPRLTSRNYATHPYITKTKESFDYWLDYNLRRGSKTQYATYTPHIHTKITKELVPETITQIK